MKILSNQGLMTLLLVAIASPCSALSWDDLWQTQDQQASEAYQQQQYQQAADQFQDTQWKAAAEYKAGNYDQAIELLNDINSIEANYNKGNAYAKLGSYQEALDAYQAVLNDNPDHADAQYNKELIEKEMQKQEKQEQQDQDNQENQEQNEDQQQQDGEENQDQQGQQSKDQQQQDQSGSESQDQQQEPQNESDAQSEPKPDSEQEQEQKNAQQAGDEDPQQQATDAEQQAQAEPQDEAQQASEQWLKRIPDDPAGLLKRKFAYQYNNRNTRQNTSQEQW